MLAKLLKACSAEYQAALMNKAMVAAIALTDIYLAAGTGEGGAGDVAQMWVLMGALFCVATPCGSTAAERAEKATPPKGTVTPLAAEWISAQWVSIALRAVMMTAGGFGFWMWRPDLLPYIATAFPACVVEDVAIRWGFKPMKIARIGEGAFGLQVISGVTLAVTNVIASWVLAEYYELGLFGVGLGTLIAETVAGILPVTVAYSKGALVRPSWSRGVEVWKDSLAATKTGVVAGIKLLALVAVIGLLEGDAKDAFALITETAFSAAMVLGAVVRVTQRKARRGAPEDRIPRWVRASGSLHRPLQIIATIAVVAYLLLMGTGVVGAIGGLVYTAGLLAVSERLLLTTTLRCEEDEELAAAQKRADLCKVALWAILAAAGWVSAPSLIISELVGHLWLWLELRALK